MNFWDGKCFGCYFWGALIAIIGLSAKPIYKDIKKGKNEKVISYNVGGSFSDSASTNK